MTRGEAEAKDGRAATLDIRLLGPITAERDGESVSLGGPRQRAVLARLALVSGQVVTVDRLVDDVWAGDPPATAVNTLQSYVSLLRRALGDPQLLRREGPGYVLAVDRHVFDTARFEDRVAEARTALGTDPHGALVHLEAGLAEWHGPVLADVVDEEWARPAAVRWDELRLEALETRFDALLALRRHSEAVGELERTSDEYPLREGFARRLMIALYRSGRQADALRVYARTRAVLAEELGLDPTPELSDLQTAILNHDPDLAAPAHVSTAAPVEAPPERPAAAAATPAPSPPPASPVALPGPAVRAGSGDFVGRDQQLARLHRLWSASLGGDSHVALLVGEAGAGKSRLAARLAAEVHDLGAIVLWGRATAEAIVPFEPMVEAVRTVLRTVSPEARRRIAAERGLLQLLLPELEQLVPEARFERPDPSVERYLLFETVAELLRTESSEHPMLIILDDLHWADAPSLKMIEHVLRHELPGRVMVVATVRAPADEPTPELDRVAAGLARDGLLTRVAVGGLAIDSVAELLRMSGREVEGAAELYAATGGNAFFLTELIRHTNGAIGTDLPESIRAMIGLRLDRLDPVVVQVLNLAAVAGPAATLPVLGAASGLEGDQLLDATDAAVTAGLLVEDGAGRLGMPHALIGQAIRARIGRTRRLDLHRRVAAAIELASERRSSPSMLAHHLLEAGSLVEREVRVAAGLAAGRNSLDLGAFEDAAAWVERVDALVTDQIEPRDRAELALLRCDTARSQGDRAGAVAAARDAAAWGRATGEPMLLARAAEGWMMSLSGIGFDIGQPADSELVDLMEQAIASLPEEEKRYRVRIRSMLTSVLVATTDSTRREELAAEALAIAEADGDAELIASAQLARRLALWRRDELHERTAAVLVAVDEARRSGNVHLELTASMFAMSDLLELGRADEHRELLNQFRARAAALHMPIYEVYAHFIEASHRLAAGDYAEAQRLADLALETGRSAHGVNAEIVYAGIKYRMAQDLDRRVALIDESERMVAANPRMRLWQIARLGALVDAGRLDEVRPIFEDVVGEDGVRLPDNQMFLISTCALVAAAAALGDRERALILRRTLEPYADRLAVSGLGGISIGPVSRYVGVAAMASGDADAATRYLQQAVADDVRLGSRAHEAQTRADLADALAARGRPGDQEAAAAEVAAARRIAGAIGLVLRRRE